MKATVAVHSERIKSNHPAWLPKAEECQVAALDIEGDAHLVAAALRALADSICPPIVHASEGVPNA